MIFNSVLAAGGVAPSPTEYEIAYTSRKTFPTPSGPPSAFEGETVTVNDGGYMTFYLIVERDDTGELIAEGDYTVTFTMPASSVTVANMAVA